MNARAVSDASAIDASGFSSLATPESVNRRVYVDPMVFEEEMRRIFQSTWVYVAHASEIANAGDYKTTQVGTNPVIVSRDRNGIVRVLSNRCRHRAASVCQWRSGNASSFRCQFHGWTYDQSGRLIGVPYREGYEGIDQEDIALESAPKVDDYRGFIFTSFNPTIRPLAEHLGDARNFLDRFADHVSGYDLEVTPHAQRLGYQGNWKMQLENSLDGYHANFTHQSFYALMQKRTGKPGRHIDSERTSDSITLGNGHAALELRGAAGDVLRRRLSTLPGAPPDDVTLDDFFGVPNAQALYDATPGPGFNLMVFPNLALVGIQIREIHPMAVNRSEVVIRPTLAKGAPAIANRLRLRYHELFYGPAGFGQPDDLEMFQRVAAGLSAGNDSWIRLDRGMNREQVDDSGHVRADITDETPQREQYKEWRRLMENSGDSVQG